MVLIIAILAVVALGIVVIAVKEDKKFKNTIKLQKKIAEGFKPNAVDRDGDGIVQEGTKWERPASAKKAPAAKKKPVAKAKPAAKKKSSSTSKPKKKTVAKKKTK